MEETNAAIGICRWRAADAECFRRTHPSQNLEANESTRLVWSARVVLSGKKRTATVDQTKQEQEARGCNAAHEPQMGGNLWPDFNALRSEDAGRQSVPLED